MTSSFVITIHDTKIQEAKYIEVEIEREKDRVTGVLWIVWRNWVEIILVNSVSEVLVPREPLGSARFHVFVTLLR